MADVFMSGARGGSIAGARSAAGSKKSSTKSLRGGGEFVYEPANETGPKFVGSARTAEKWEAVPVESLKKADPVAEETGAEENPTSKPETGKKGKAGKGKNAKKTNAEGLSAIKDAPAANDDIAKTSPFSKNDEIARRTSSPMEQRQQSGNPHPQTMVAAPWNENPSRKSQPTGWQPPSVRTASDVPKTSHQEASLRTSVEGWKGAEELGIYNLGEGIYEPRRSNSGSRVQAINTEHLFTPSPVREDISARSSSQRVSRHDTRTEIRHGYLHPETPPSVPQSQISLATSVSQQEFEEPFGWGSHQSYIKQEARTASPQVTHTFHRPSPSEASSHAFIPQVATIYSPQHHNSGLRYANVAARSGFTPPPYQPSPQWQQAPFSSHGPSPRHYPLPPSSGGNPQSSIRRNDDILGNRPPTVFAGRGWISPHPLSVAPSWVSNPPPPQRAIRLPPGHRWTSNGGTPPPAWQETMTYEQWRAVQQESVISQRREADREEAAVVSQRDG